MKPTYTLLEHEKRVESLHDGDSTKIGLQPKMDCSGIWTEGYGKAMRFEGKYLKGIENKELAYSLATIKTEKEAIENLKSRMIKVEEEVRKHLFVELKQYQIDALTSHADNCGISPTLYNLINKGMFDDLKNFWTKNYVKSAGVRLPGLIKRRCTEYYWFSTGIYEIDAWKFYYDELK
jgi:lysozyme